MWIIPAVIIILMIVIFSVIWTHPWGGPWIPSSRTAVQQMLNLAEIKPDEIVYDLGCGDGRIIIAAARQFGARAVGIELDPLRWLWCQFLVRVLGLQKRISVLHGDLYQQDLGLADVVTCYLLPEATQKLEKKLLSELKPSARVVSNTFLFPGMQEVARTGKIRLYRFTPENTLEHYLKDQLLTQSTKKDT